MWVITGYWHYWRKISLCILASTSPIWRNHLSETHAWKNCEVMDLAIEKTVRPVMTERQVRSANSRRSLFSLGGLMRHFLSPTWMGVRCRVPQDFCRHGPCAGGSSLLSLPWPILFSWWKYLASCFVTGPNVVKIGDSRKCNSRRNLGGASTHSTKKRCLTHFACANEAECI